MDEPDQIQCNLNCVAGIAVKPAAFLAFSFVASIFIQ
jgi:hypothetical protein